MFRGARKAHCYLKVDGGGGGGGGGGGAEAEGEYTRVNNTKDFGYC